MRAPWQQVHGHGMRMQNVGGARTRSWVMGHHIRCHLWAPEEINSSQPGSIWIASASRVEGLHAENARDSMVQVCNIQSALGSWLGISDITATAISTCAHTYAHGGQPLDPSTCSRAGGWSGTACATLNPTIDSSSLL